MQLLNEGVKVYRPVEATPINDDIYKIESNDGIYKPDDELWEFLPGDLVIVEEQ